MPKHLQETSRLVTEATKGDGTRRPIQIITPGWGSSGYYSTEVLERAAENKIIPAGTHMYFNHASATEQRDRPERDVREIAAVTAEDAVWDGTRLVAEADILGPHVELIDALAPYIGLSISGSATDITVGEAEGRKGPIIEDLAHVDSVDFVTHAGRGGMVLLESARPSIVNANAVERGIAEATADERRRQLSDVVRATYGGEGAYAWVQDFDEERVWFEASSDDEPSHTWEQTYLVADDDLSVELTGSRTEVRAVTKYVPVARPGNTTTATTESKEDNMGNIQIDEAEHGRLVETAGRVDTLISERDTEKRRADLAEATLAATGVITAESAAAKVQFTVLEQRGLLADLPLTEAGALDTEAFTETVQKAAQDKAKALEAATTDPAAGTVRGFGGTPAGDAVTETSKPTRSPWGRDLTEKGA